MTTTPPAHERRRLKALASYRILDTPPEAPFDRLARMAADRFGTPFAAVNLIDDTRNFFMAVHGADVREIPLFDTTPCLTVLNSRDPLVVSDARADERYRGFPLVAGEPRIRFYATAPIEDADGFILGTLIIADTRPRELSEREVRRLEDHASMAADLLASRRTTQWLAMEQEAQLAVTESIPDVIFSLSATGEFTYLNPAFGQATGREPSEWLGRSFEDLVDPEDPEDPEDRVELRDLVSGVLRGDTVRSDVRVTTPGGARVFDVIAVPRRGDTASPIAGIARDLTERKEQEIALRRAEVRYRAVFDHSVDGVMRTSPDGPIFELNQAMMDMLGYTEEDLQMRRLHRNDVVDLSDPRLPAALEEPRRTGKGRGVLRYKRKDGSTFPVELTSSVYQDPDGSDRSVIIARDISGQVQREEALRESEERFAKTFHGNPLAAVVVSVETARVMVANPAFAKATGYSMEEIEGRNLYDLDLVLDDEHDCRRNVLQAMVTHGHKEPYDGPFRTKDGTIRHGEYFFERIEIAGEPCMVILIHDVTDQKRAEAVAERELEFTDAIINSLPGVFYVHDGSTFVRWNRNLERITGYTTEELTNLSVTDFVAETDVLLERVQEAFERGSTMMEGHLVTKVGERIPYILTGERALLNGKPYLVGVGIDITEQKQAIEELQQTQAQLERAERSALVMTAHMGLDGSWLKVPPGLSDLVGYTQVEIKDMTVQEMMHPDDWDVMHAGHKRMRSGVINSFEMEKRYIHKDGPYVWVYCNQSLVRDEEGGALYLLSYIRDINDVKKAEKALNTRAKQQAAVAQLSQYVLSDVSLQDVLDEAARVVSDTLDAELSGVLEVTADRQRLVLDSGTNWKHRARVEARDEERHSVAELSLATPEPIIITDLMHDPRISPLDVLHDQGVVSGVSAMIPGRTRPFGAIGAFSRERVEYSQDDAHFIRSVANLLSGAIEQRSLLDVLADRAEHDDLTGLPNRSAFLACLEGAIAEAQSDDTMVAMLFLDLDRFKHINDSLGHHAGDELLKGVAQRVSGILRGGDVLARLAGDEFVIMLSGICRKVDVAEVTHRILKAFDEPYPVAERFITVKATVGISIYPEDAQDATSLLRGSDSAMYQGKAYGRNTFQFFTPEMDAKATERLDLESDLRQALHRNEFELHYQPQVKLVTREVIGFEALLRWHHPERGLIPPDRFIPIAEDTGLIIPIGEWVMREAFGQLKVWKDDGAGPLRMAVNVAAPQFTQAGFTATVQRITEEAGLHPGDVELEITESVVLHDADLVAKELTALEALGFRVAIDDFGTGYSSLAYLRDLPIDRIKIDRDFTRQIDGDEAGGGTAFVEAMIRLASSLDLGVVAEGIETDEQVRVLRELGCLEGQGYLFAKPLPAREVLPRLLPDPT